MALAVANGTTIFKCYPIRPAIQLGNQAGAQAVISLYGATAATAVKAGDAIRFVSGFAAVNNAPTKTLSADATFIGFAAAPKAAFTQDVDQFLQIYPAMEHTMFEGTYVTDATNSVAAISATFATGVALVGGIAGDLIEAEATATGGSFCVVTAAGTTAIGVTKLSFAWRQPDGGLGYAGVSGKQNVRVVFNCKHSVFAQDRTS